MNKTLSGVEGVFGRNLKRSKIEKSKVRYFYKWKFPPKLPRRPGQGLIISHCTSYYYYENENIS